MTLNSSLRDVFTIIIRRESAFNEKNLIRPGGGF